MKKSLRNRIALANKYIRFAQRCHIYGTGYFGSTWPVQIEYTNEVSISPKGNSVRVRYRDHAQVRDTKVDERFDVRDDEREGDLRYEISNYIIKAIKNGAREDGVPVPSFKAAA